MAEFSNSDILKYIEFMKAHIIQKHSNVIPTHTLLGPLAKGYADFRGSYNIDGVDYDKFLILYKNVINKIPLHVVERQKEIGPLVIDIDFNTEKNSKKDNIWIHI